MIFKFGSVILRHTSGTTSTTSGTTWYYETLGCTKIGTTTYSDYILRSTTSGTTRYYEWYYESLRGTTSGTISQYEVLRVVKRVTTSHSEKFQVLRVVF